MNRFIHWTLYVMLLWAASTAAHGAETIGEAWESAVNSDLTLQAVRHTERAFDEQLKAAEAERKPFIGFNTSALQLDSSPSFSFGENFSSPPIFQDDQLLLAGAQIRVPLYTGGAVSQGINAARSASDASRFRVMVSTQDLKLAVAESFVAVLRAESSLSVADSTITSLAAQTRDAKNRYDFGSVPQNDYLAASVSLADAQQRRLQAENGLEIARAAYNRRLSRPLSAPVRLNPDLPPPEPQTALQLELMELNQLIELARKNRGELAELESQVQGISSRSQAERGGLYPQVSLMGGYTLLDTQVLNDSGFWSIGIGVSWNLFDGGRIRSRTSALEIQAQSLHLLRADLVTKIALQVHSASLSVKEAKARVSVAEKAVDQANENLRVSRDRYKAGSGTSTEVLDAEALRTISLSNRDNARYDHAIARYRLARAVGVL